MPGLVHPRHTQLSRNLRAALCILAPPPEVDLLEGPGYALVTTPSVIVSVWAHECRPDCAAPACCRDVPTTQTKARQEMKSSRFWGCLGPSGASVVRGCEAIAFHVRREKPQQARSRTITRALYHIQHLLSRTGKRFPCTFLLRHTSTTALAHWRSAADYRPALRCCRHWSSIIWQLRDASQELIDGRDGQPQEKVGQPYGKQT